MQDPARCELFLLRATCHVPTYIRAEIRMLKQTVRYVLAMLGMKRNTASNASVVCG